MKKAKVKVNLKRIIILITILLFLLIIIIKCLTKNNKYSTNDSSQNVISQNVMTIEENKSKRDLEFLMNMSERDRMQYYIGKYFSYIQDKNYGEAYSLLYEEYVQEYFPIYTDYVNYIQEKYPFDLIAIEYNNIERIGNLYVLWVNVVDAVNGNPMAEDKLEQKIVIRENGFNDFELSFSK